MKEPPGWFVDSTIAREFGANVILYPTARDPHLPDTPVIRLFVTKKISEDIGADLKHAADRYRSRYHNVEFRDIVASHPHYRAYAKLFCVPGRFCEYLTYLDPGPRSFLLSVAITTPGHAATAIELGAYKRVVASLNAN